MIPDGGPDAAEALVVLLVVHRVALLADVRDGANTAESGLFDVVPFGQGRLPAPLMARLIAEYVPPTTPLVLLPGELDAQRALLGL